MSPSAMMTPGSQRNSGGSAQWDRTGRYGL